MPENRPFDVVGLGGNAADYIVTVPRHPNHGEKMRFTSFSYQGGGRTATAMVAISRLGLRARYLGGIGDDPEGRMNLEGLRAEGVDVSGVLTRPGAFTQRAFIQVDEQSGERTIVWGRGEGIPLEPAEVDDRAIVSGRIFYTDAQDPRTAARAAPAAHGAGMPIIADIEDVRPGLDDFLPFVDFLIVSAHFPALATDSRHLEDAMRILEERTRGGLIIVTQGASGSIARIDGTLERFPAYAVDVRDTTGAGDVFHAAFAVACVRGMDVARSDRLQQRGRSDEVPAGGRARRDSAEHGGNRAVQATDPEENP